MIAMTDIADEISIMNCSGYGPDPGTSRDDASTDNADPPPIVMAAPRPLAVPARRGLTDNMPALAFGSAMPLPKPTKVTKAKKPTGWVMPEA